MQGIALPPPAESAEGVWGAKGSPKKEGASINNINLLINKKINKK
ncbi:MAG: hypothetical protein PHH77_00850 [Victivallaceae bacterium]|nr:hypothetical protein [Victivallaceae bacterium]